MMSICKFILFTHGAAEPGFLGDAVNFGRTVVGQTVKKEVINKAAGAVHEAIIGKNDKSSKSSTECFEIGILYKGTVIEWWDGESPKLCQAACGRVDGCEFWSYEEKEVGKAKGKCYMKREIGDEVANDKYTSGPRKCGVQGAASKSSGAASKFGTSLLKTGKNLIKKKVLGAAAPFLDTSLIGNAFSTAKKLIKGVAKVPYGLVTAPIHTTKTVLETGVRAVVHTAKSAIKDPKLIVIAAKTAISGKPSVSSIPFAIKHATSGIDQALDDVAGRLDPKNLTRRNLRNGETRKKIKTVLKNAGKVVKEAAKSAGRVGKATVKSAVKDPKVLALAAGSLMTGVPNPALVPLVAGHLAEGISDVEAAGQRTLSV